MGGPIGSLGMTHRELCVLACRWLTRQKCSVVFADFNSMKLCEFPDAIGFRYGSQFGPSCSTVVVEVKTSREDFRRDANKGWKHRERHGSDFGHGMGTHRYYLVPDGLIADQECPHDHGLLYALADGKVRVVRKAPLREKRDVVSEMIVLTTALQRHQAGVSWFGDKYRFETRNEAAIRGALQQEETP